MYKYNKYLNYSFDFFLGIASGCRLQAQFNFGYGMIITIREFITKYVQRLSGILPISNSDFGDHCRFRNINIVGRGEENYVCRRKNHVNDSSTCFKNISYTRWLTAYIRGKSLFSCT